MKTLLAFARVHRVLEGAVAAGWLAACLLLWAGAAPATPEADCFDRHECLDRIPERDPQQPHFKDSVDGEGYLHGPCAWHKWGGCFSGGNYPAGPSVAGVLAQYEANIEATPGCGCDVVFERGEDWLAEGGYHDTPCGEFPVVGAGIETGNRQTYLIHEQCPSDPQPVYRGWFFFQRKRFTTCPPGSDAGTVPGTSVPTCGVSDEAPLRNTGNCPVRGKGAAAAAMSPVVKNPVNAATGNKYQRETDYLSPVAAGLRLQRHYNSERRVRPGVLGRQWRHSYERRIEHVQSTVGVWREDGRALFFTRTLDGTWRSRTGTVATLTDVIDDTGALSGWVYRPGDDSVERYDAEGRLLTLTHRGGFTHTLAYDDAGRLATVTGPFGRTLTFSYQDGRLASVVDPAGATIRYAYSDGMLSAVTYPDATPEDPGDDPVRVYHYEDPAFPRHLSGISDERGIRIATWTYDDGGRAVSSEHADGADRATFRYNADGTTTVIDALGHAQVLAFALDHGVWRTEETTGGGCVACAGGTQRTEVDDNGFLARSVSYNGHATDYVHDARGLEVSRTEAVGTPLERTTTTAWHPEFRVPLRIDAPGRTTAFSYDAAGRLLTRTETDTANGRSRRVAYAYDAQGLPVRIDGPRTDVDDVVELAYVDGVVSRVVNALGHETRITEHDAHGRALRMVDPNGLVTELGYDPRGRLTSRRVDGLETRYVYDAAGHLVRTILPDGGVLDVERDAAGRVVAMTDALGNRVEYNLDAAGNRVAEHHYGPDGTLAASIRQVFDTRGRRVERIGGEGERRTFAYDAMDNRVAALDGEGRATTYRYDALERLVESIDPLAGTTAYAYDARDDLVAVTDARGLTTGYTVDGLGDLRGESSPDRGVRAYDTDAAGNRIAETDGRGVTAVLAYDALNRLTAVTYPTPEQDITYTYDTAPNGIGRLAAVNDESGTTHYEYDRRGNLAVETRVIAGEPFTTRYTHDALDRVAAMTYPSGRTVRYTRDLAGRVTALHLEHDGATTALVTDVHHDGAGRMVAWTLGNGHRVEQHFDRSGRTTALDTPGILERRYTHDANDNVTAIEDLLHPDASQQFGYDALDRLTAAEGVYGPIDYDYDALGNRTRRSEGATTEHYLYGVDSNRLLEVVGPEGAAFAYDAAGNTVTRGERNYAYGDSGRLAVATLNGVEQARYRYNAAGERSVRETAQGRTRYVFDQAGQMVAEVDDDGRAREYVYLAGRPLAVLETAAAVQPEPTVFVVRGSDPTTGTVMEAHVDLEARTLEVRENGEVTQSGGRVSVAVKTRNTTPPATGMRVIQRFPDGRAAYLSIGFRGDIVDNVGGGRLVLYGDRKERWESLRFDRLDANGRFHTPAGTAPAYEATFDPAAARFTVYHPDGSVERDLDLSAFQAWETTTGEQVTHAYSLRSGKLTQSLSVVTDTGHPESSDARYSLREVLTEVRYYRTLTVTAESSPGAATDAVRYYHTDHLGTPQVLTDESGVVAWQADYQPFGAVLETVADVEQALRYPGQVADGGAGGYYNYQRYYDPTTGRYLRSDPVGLDGGINTYGYALQNPIRYSDPLGLRPDITHRLRACTPRDDCQTLKDKAGRLALSIAERRRQMAPYSVSGQPWRQYVGHAIQIKQQFIMLRRCQQLFDEHKPPCDGNCETFDPYPLPPWKPEPHEVLSAEYSPISPWQLLPLIPLLTPWPDPY